MARGNYREYLKGDVVWIKKYFYVLRPILAMNWIERVWGVVPTDFNILVDKLAIEPPVAKEIARLLAAKRGSGKRTGKPFHAPNGETSPLFLFLPFGWGLLPLCPELQALLSPSPLAVQFLCPFDPLVLAHKTSSLFGPLNLSTG